MNSSHSSPVIFKVRVTARDGSAMPGSKGYVIRVQPDGRGGCLAWILDSTVGADIAESPLRCRDVEDAEKIVLAHLATIHPGWRFRITKLDDEQESGPASEHR